MTYIVFSSLAQEHIQNPRNVGAIPDATHYGVAGVPGDGPFVELWFKVAGDTIEHGSYRTYGCPTSIASSSVVVDLVRNRPVAVALSINEHDIKNLIGEIPEGKGDCPPRVVAALQSALGVKAS